MKKTNFFYLFTFLITCLSAQKTLSPELFLQVGRVSGVGYNAETKELIYKVTKPDLASNKNKSQLFSTTLSGDKTSEIDSIGNRIKNKNISPNLQCKITVKSVKLVKVYGKEMHNDLPLSSAQLYDNLNFRHWDSWEDGNYNHLFLHEFKNGTFTEGVDLMPNEAYDCPTMPFGDESDYTWTNDSKAIVYVCKKAYGTAYAISTNTDLYQYDIETGKTTNLTEGMKGYDTKPSFSSLGNLAWLSMERDGYEADKQDIIVKNQVGNLNLTKNWDGTVNQFVWSKDGKRVFFLAPVLGTIQLFTVDYPGLTKKLPIVEQITKGDFDLSAIVGLGDQQIIVTKNDMNRAPEIVAVDLKTGKITNITRVNDAFYSNINPCKIEKRIANTTDNKNLLSWIIYPPNFDPSKKYPTLLYCQGGPQSALTQIYSFRWNFQLMASQGYIVVAVNRRGMPGYGVKWNEQISKDWGGQVMDDYLTAIDDISKESYVDKSRLGCVGASYGGYSVFNLAGIHQNRFKTFIAHAGVFNLVSMYGTTEEIFFSNFDMGGAYWEKDNKAAQNTYQKFNPADRVQNWNTPMLITHGGKDFRVPEGQGFEAFTALQLKGIKSKFLYFPDENHWILKPQNALNWHREFYSWLNETL